MKLGNIYDLYPNEYEDVFNKVNEIRLDLPLLIVGWKIAKKYFSNSFEIHKKEIREDVFWTFKKGVNLTEYQTDLNEFKKYCLRKKVNSLKYLEYDLYQHSLKDINFKNISSVSLVDNIIYYKDSNEIRWIDLEVASLLGLNVIYTFKQKGVNLRVVENVNIMGIDLPYSMALK